MRCYYLWKEEKFARKAEASYKAMLFMDVIKYRALSMRYGNKAANAFF